ncbi:MAG: hypothetical protein CM1200mP27_04080 [Chloroflexota bacterium]|nr:MAG: hypothetical protein CM1200mP27_04080 [Chloroflexota bacterium]
MRQKSELLVFNVKRQLKRGSRCYGLSIKWVFSALLIGTNEAEMKYKTNGIDISISHRV